MHTHLSEHKLKSLKLAKQAQGTLTKVVAMIESDTYCPEVIQQADSVCGLIRSVKKEMLTGHLHHCAVEQLQQNKDKAIAELLKIYGLSTQ